MGRTPRRAETEGGGLSYREKRGSGVGWRPEDWAPTEVSKAPITTPGSACEAQGRGQEGVEERRGGRGGPRGTAGSLLVRRERRPQRGRSARVPTDSWPPTGELGGREGGGQGTSTKAAGCGPEGGAWGGGQSSEKEVDSRQWRSVATPGEGGRPRRGGQGEKSRTSGLRTSVDST